MHCVSLRLSVNGGNVDKADERGTEPAKMWEERPNAAERGGEMKSNR